VTILSHEFEPAQIVAHTIEQALAATEKRRHEVDLHLVYEACRFS
jgi:hypothetical protein